MKKTTRPGQPVSFSIGRGKNLVRLTGMVERISGDWVQIRANGNLYEVHRLRAMDVLTCVVCGKARSYNSRRYCSSGCRTIEAQQDHDDWVFQTIIDFKAKHDGCAPSLREIMRHSGLSERLVENAMGRLRQAGRIQTVNSNTHCRIIVSGGRWVYEGGSDGDAKSYLAKENFGGRTRQ